MIHYNDDTGHQSSLLPTEEAAFSFDELFFSRTDERGIILSGNSLFQRISMYPWGELLNKPHNLIRHPDMPKAVFWLLWDTIKRGEPIGAYVKNRAKDGRYYWVFAIVTPIEGGYLSVRLKPSSPIFDVVKQEYAALLSQEKSKQLRPAESGEILLNRLKELGFLDYKSFMAAALGHEIMARDKMLEKKPNPIIAIFEELLSLSQELLKQAEVVFEAYAVNEFVPLNLRVQAAQLGESGKTIDVISNNYNIISEEIKSSMEHFIRSARLVAETVQNGLFLVGTAAIQKEVWEHFSEEPSQQGFDNSNEAALLNQQQISYNEKATKGLHNIAVQVKDFRSSCLEMKRSVAALEVTRVMGKVETARLKISDTTLTELIDELETFQQTLTNSLKTIQDLNYEVQINIDTLLDSPARKTG